MKKFIIALIIIAMAGMEGNAQYRTIHAYSFYGGYGFFKSDFGSRRDWRTNFSNNSAQVGMRLYFNLFPYYTSSISHFRYYLGVEAIKGYLNHTGYWAEKDSPMAQKLRAMTANPLLAGANLGIEYWVQDLRYYDYSRLYGIYRFNFYVGGSVNGYYYRPNVKSSLGNVDDPVEQQEILYPRFVGHVFNQQGFAFSATVKFGFTYQLNDYFHLFWEHPFTWFPNDKVDGLDVNDQADRYADWIYTPLIGISYILP